MIKINVLFIASKFPTVNEGKNIYTDLAEELKKQGNNVTVVVSEEKNKIKKTQFLKERNINVLRVRTGNVYNVNLYEKAVSFITMQNKMKKEIDIYLSKFKFDIIIFMSPPVTIYKVVKYAMRKFDCVSYLMQKDIFPQNAVDLKILTRYSPAYLYFRYKEKMLYKTATIIGCMSEKNIEYLLKNNNFLNSDKLEIFPNTIKISEKENKIDIREKYNISKDKVIAIYGGNFGKAQGIDFLIKILKEYKNNNKVEFILIGRGTEKDRIFNYVKKQKIDNVICEDFMNDKKYSEFLQNADIGLVFLDHRFTVPNIPSRTLSYFEYSIPIMAATDSNTDYKDLIEKQSKSGLWASSNNINEFKIKFEFLLNNETERKKLGQNGNKFLRMYLTTDKSVKILENSFKRLNNDKF